MKSIKTLCPWSSFLDVIFLLSGIYIYININIYICIYIYIYIFRKREQRFRKVFKVWIRNFELTKSKCNRQLKFSLKNLTKQSRVNSRYDENFLKNVLPNDYYTKDIR